MFREGDHECIKRLQQPSAGLLGTGLAVKNEPFGKRQALWHTIRANSDRYKNGDCGTFLKDLNSLFLSRFDASLLLLAVAFRQNNEPFEGSAYFNAREIEAFETVERYGYFRILSKSEIAKKIRSKDEKTLSLLQEYSAGRKKHMDAILSDEEIRDTIRTYLKKQWGEDTRKIGDAIRDAGVDLDWFASLPAKSAESDTPRTIIINAGNDAAINLGTGNIVKDAVLTGSRVESSGSGSTTIRDSVVTKSTVSARGAKETGGGNEGIRISDSVITSSRVENVHEHSPEPETVPATQKPAFLCLVCNTPAKAGAKFCTTCGAAVSRVCSSCHAILVSHARFCPQCGKKIS